MKLTESKLIQIIKEELQKVITEQEVLQEESPRDAMRRLAKQAGGFSKLMDLPKTDKLRVDFRKAFRARRAGKKTINLGRTEQLPAPGTGDILTTKKPMRSAADMAKDIQQDQDAASQRVAAMVAKAKKDVGGYGKPGKKVDPASPDERKIQRGLAKASDKPYSPPSAGAGFQGREVKPIR